MILLLALAVCANADEVPLHLVSWNVHGLFWPVAHRTNQRMHAIAKKVIDLTPDIVVFEEVWFASRADALSHDLTGAGYAAVPIRKGGLLVFYKPTWTVKLLEFKRYKSIAPKIFFWQADGLSGKGFLVLDVATQDQKHFTLIDTHLQSQYGRLFRWKKVRDNELQQLADYATNGTTIFAGDFNTWPDEKMMKKFKETVGELTEQARIDCSCGSSWSGKKRAEWIDYVFVRPIGYATAKVYLISNTHADDPYSDHDGIDSHLVINVP